MHTLKQQTNLVRRSFLVTGKWAMRKYRTIGNMKTGARKFTSVSIPADTYEMLTTLAEENHRSLAGQITYLVSKNYELELAGGHVGFPSADARDGFNHAMDREERKDMKESKE
tara:strand:- start:1499 stop:1837 length:339 start_codon:yes stop_codon:yes gene_type:complete